MAHVSLVDPRYQVSVRSGLLVVSLDGDVQRTLRPREVEELHLHGGVHLTGAARGLLLRRGIDVIYLDRNGRHLGRMITRDSKQAARRLAQYALAQDPDRSLSAARTLVVAKIRNQRAVLLRRQRRLRDAEVADQLAAMRSLAERAAQAPDLDVLRGLEGAAAARHFAVLALQLRHAEICFNGRNRRPPRDPVNAALSFGYTLLVIAVESAVRTAGLDPHIGLLHATIRGAPSLALDLAEPWRPEVDHMVWTLFNRGQLNPGDFRTPEGDELDPEVDAEGAVYLGDLGRRILLRAWHDLLARTFSHPLRAESWPLRSLLVESANQVTRVAEGNQEQLVPVRLSDGH